MAVDGVSLVLFGSLSRFTFLTLQELLNRQLPPYGIVLAAHPPAPRHSPVRLYDSPQHPIAELAGGYDIPIHFFRGDIAPLITFLRAQSADIYLLSCYPRRLPLSITQLAKYYCINIHPSRLPQHRGADPLFWQLRGGETETGVTLHKVSELLDGGDILTFLPIAYPCGARLTDIQSVLLKGAVFRLEELLHTPLSKWHFTPQGHTQSSGWPPPCAADFVINTDISAQVAFNFVRAYSHLQWPIKVVDNQTIYLVQDAIRYELQPMSMDRIVKTGFVSIEFCDGIVEFFVT